MADTAYTDNVTVVTADTMNDLNRLHYTIFGDPADDAAARTGIGAAASGANTDITSLGIIGNAFMASAPGGQVVTTGAAQKITFSTEDLDDGANYDAVTNYRYVAPSTGIYRLNVDLAVYASSNSRVIAVYLYKNGSSYKYSNVSLVIGVAGNNYATTSIEVVDDFTATDYFEVFATTTDASVTVDPGSRFSGSRIY